jgi:hypothetical protein
MPIKKVAPDEYQDPQIVNPLTKYYRVPGVYVRLPTDGAFMPPGSIDWTMNREVAVFPLRSADEMLLKNPDALMSGHAIESLLRSCVPAIRFPRLISSPDLDVLLIAMRAATSGETLELDVTCPQCQKAMTTHVSLGHMFTTIQTVDADNPVRLNDDIVVHMRPHNLANGTQLAMVSFEETRKVQAVENAEPEVRIKQVTASMQRITDLSVEVLASCVVRVVVREGSITDQSMILDFLRNVNKNWVTALQDKLDELNQRGIDKHYPVTCPACQHAWQGEVEFNPSTFFA